MNPFPQKKIMTFNKHVKDFTFYVNYQVIAQGYNTRQNTMVLGRGGEAIYGFWGKESVPKSI